MSAQGNVSSLAVERGQRAWKSIKHVDKDTRECWLDVGAALAEGRALHQANRAFSQWCAANGFGDMAPSVRSECHLGG